MATPPMAADWTPDSMWILGWAGVLWAALLGWLSAPRWSGAARWWPIPGIIGLLAYGAWTGLLIGAYLDTVEYLVGDTSPVGAAVAGSAMLVGLALVARLGPRGPDPTRPHLIAGVLVLALLLGTWSTLSRFVHAFLL